MLVSALAPALLCGVVGVAFAQATSATSSAQQPLVLDHVAVVDVEQGKITPDRRVVIVGSRIQAIGRAGTMPRPKGARLVDARGKYLIPGLWDMHSHTLATPGPEANADRALDRYAAYLPNGVTGVRDMYLGVTNVFSDDVTAISPDALRRWRQAVAAGSRKGPRVVGGVRIRPSGLPGTPDEAIRAVDSVKALGADFIKVQSWQDSLPRRDVFFAILAEARRVGLTVVGHLPFNVTMAEASDSGFRSMEHFHYFSGPCWQPGSAADAQCRELGERLRRNGTWLTPTFLARSDAMKPRPPGWESSHVPDTVRVGDILHIKGDDVSRVDGLWFVHRAHSFGSFPWLAGTDVMLGIGTDLPVWAIHKELELFVKAGLTPLEALQTATLNPAKYLDATDSLGTVATGKLADLVLLDANPLADITNTEKVRAVVANGRYYDRATLDAMLKEAESNFAQQP